VEASAWPRHLLDEIIGQIRRLLDVSGCAFQVVDLDAGVIRLAAAWFATPEVKVAMSPVLQRPYDRARPGVTEAAIERGDAVLIQRIEDWPGAGPLRERLEIRLDPDSAALAWEWYRASSFISCPVRTASGRILGVLAISANVPHRPLGEDELRVVRVCADLAGLALERAELLESEERRGREERDLAEAGRRLSSSLDLDEVYRVLVDQSARLTGATKVALRRLEPATQDLRMIAARGISEDGMRLRHRVGEGLIGEVARSGRAYASRPEDAERFISEFVALEGIGSFAHVPIAMGQRVFGVLSVSHEGAGRFGSSELRRLEALCRVAAGAIANALDFQRERRLADALTRGFVAVRPSELPGYELGIIYEPAGQGVSGGDLFGVWRLPSGALAVLVGDVSGKGLEVAALSAMVRFFVEARTWDSEHPGEVLAQADALLSTRLPAGGFATAFMAVIAGGHVRWANAGHAPPLILGPGHARPLGATGLPLGVGDEPAYGEDEAPFGDGEVLFAATDGLLEARRDGVFFGEERLPAILAEHALARSPEELVREVRHAVEEWTPHLDDDLMILALRSCA
jgi:GAF domain-containing protein